MECLRLSKKYNLDPNNAFMIGDKKSDYFAAKNQD